MNKTQKNDFLKFVMLCSGVFVVAIGTREVRGVGLLIILAGLVLSVTAILLYHIKSITGLENRGEVCTEN